MSCITINNRQIGGNSPTFIIAEIAQAHDGSLGYAHSFIDAAADSGADAVKFQTHIASSESTTNDSFRIKMSGQDKTRYDYWKRMEFLLDEWVSLQKHAQDKGMIFLSSAFSIDAVMLLKNMNIGAWKVGSGEFKSTELLEAMIDTKKPILYSTGMSTYTEIKAVMDNFIKRNISHGIFQCTSQYPTPLESVGLNVIDEYMRDYDCPVGLSDHSGTVFPSLSALTKNISMLEVHVTFDKRMYGPDTIASMTFDDLALVCQARNANYIMQHNPVNKDKKAAELEQIRELFTKSISLKHSLSKGTLITRDMLMPKKPGTGIPYTDIDKVIGKFAACDVESNRLLTQEDLSDES